MQKKNLLSAISSAIFTLTRLRVLSVAKNNIPILPPFLGHMSSLNTLYVEENSIGYPTRNEISYDFPTKKDPDSDDESWTHNLKGVLQRLLANDAKFNVRTSDSEPKPTGQKMPTEESLISLPSPGLDNMVQVKD